MSAVNEPVPVPTSSTTSVGSSFAVAAIISSKFKSIKKFCPCCDFGRIPTSSNRFIR